MEASVAVVTWGVTRARIGGPTALTMGADGPAAGAPTPPPLDADALRSSMVTQRAGTSADVACVTGDHPEMRWLPPSTSMTTPVIAAASSEARNTMVLAM